jgi:hypothetical protein
VVVPSIGGSLQDLSMSVIMKKTILECSTWAELKKVGMAALASACGKMLWF